MDELYSILFKLGAVFGLAVVNGFFVAAEFAIVKVRGTRIDALVKKGNPPAKVVQHIIHNVNAYLSACQLGITITSLGLGWIGEPFVARLLVPVFTTFKITSSEALAHIFATPIAFIAITFLHIVLGEQAPKQLAIQREESTALWIAYPLKWFHSVFYPAIWLLNESANRLLRLTGIRPVPAAEQAHTEEELRFVFAESHRVGKLTATGKQIMDNVLTFTHRQVKEVMVPRTNIVGLAMNTPATDIIRTAVDTGYSRMPVYKEYLDSIAGIIYIKDILALEENRELIILSDLLRPAYFVPETKLISELLRELQKKKMHLAIVIDEYGVVTGLVTMEDLIEEIVGEIQDEYDTEEERVLKLKDGSLSVDGSMSLHDLRDDYKIRLPEEMPYDSLAGFVLDELAKIPIGGETITYENQLFTVTKVEGRRIVRVKISQIKADASQSM